MQLNYARPYRLRCIFFGVIVLHAIFFGFGQSIREDYKEMSDYEKRALVNAFYAMREGNDLIQDIANFHINYFNNDNIDPDLEDLHFNLPDEPEKEIFLAWHRMAIFEMEQAMQELNPRLSIPYWDSSVDQSASSELWDQEFLGSFNSNWGLNRNFGVRGPLPTPPEIADLMNYTDFFLFSDDAERSPVHAGAHRWVNGAMITAASPRDPVFYLHHSFVDKIWNDWQDIHGDSHYIKQDMIRYDGTHVFGGQTVPSVNPNDIIDSRALGVFYANNQLAVLDNYIVSNTYKPREYFYYRYTIEAGDGFLVPSGSSAIVESLGEVVLKPGFTALTGADFVASIDTETATISAKYLPVTDASHYKPFDQTPLESVWLWSENEINDEPVILTTFPNPFESTINVQLNSKKDYAVRIFDLTGALIREEYFENSDRLVIRDLYGLSSGTYFVKIVGNDGKALVVKKVIKL